MSVVNDAVDLTYTVWGTNEHELYDMSLDPHQMHNLLATEDDKHCKLSHWSVAWLLSGLSLAAHTRMLRKPRVHEIAGETALRGYVKSLKDATDRGDLSTCVDTVTMNVTRQVKMR